METKHQITMPYKTVAKCLIIFKMMMKCIICGLEFNTNRRWQKCCSKDCSIIRKKEYREENKEKSKEYYQENKEKRKEYYQDNKKEIKKYYQDNKKEIKKYYQDNKKEIKKYYQDNKEEIKEKRKEYREENKEKIKEYSKTPKRKEGRKRRQAKRRRNLGFNPLNVWFKNSEGHHINNTDVIYIPKKLHLNYYGHSILSNKNMEPINTVAFFFLLMQNIDEIRNLIC